MVFSFIESFVNPWMLAGILGVSLPILAHLLSKKRYDIVDWGAMQFLELGQNAKRKILLEQLLLLALRIGMIALLVFLFMRPVAGIDWSIVGPWVLNILRILLIGGLVYLFARPIFGSRTDPLQMVVVGMLMLLFAMSFQFSPKKAVDNAGRDIVIIIDSSYSMGWEGKSQTPRQEAVRSIQRFLERLSSNDHVTLIDARDQARAVIESPTRDFGNVRQELASLPEPSGTANMPEATRKAVQILTETSSQSREIVIFTDGQAKGWRADDKSVWTQYDDQLEQPSKRPRTWVMLVGEQQASKRINYSVEKLTLNREMTAVGYPVRVKTKIRAFGGEAEVKRNVFFEVDGARLNGKTQQVTLKPDTEQSVEFEYVFSQPGSHRLSVVLDKDNLPGDNRSDAAVTVTEAVPVLLVDGDPNPQDVVKSETIFALTAFTPPSNPAPWVKAEAVPWTQIAGKLKDLKQYETVVLANVPRLSDAEIAALTTYVKDGGGLFIALGNKVDKTHYNAKLFDNNAGLLPAELVSIEENKDETKQTVQVVSDSLEVPWIQRFQLKNDGGFCEARFSHRWKVRPAAAPKLPGPAPNGMKQPAGKAADAQKLQAGVFGDSIVAAMLNTNDPLLITRKTGRGGVVLMTSAIDSDWGTLISTDDYTPLLHEIVFFLAAGKTARNVDAGTPLQLEVPEDRDLKDHVFFGPDDRKFDFQSGIVANGKKTIQLEDTSLPGLYVFRGKTKEGKQDINTSPEYFVVNFDRGESDLTILSDSQRTMLTDTDNPDGTVAADAEKPARMTFYADEEALFTKVLHVGKTYEIWRWILAGFVAFLVFEVVMTRKMVQGGHADAEEPGQPVEAEDAAATSSRAQTSGLKPPPLPAGAAPAGAPPSRRRSVVSDEFDYEEY